MRYYLRMSMIALVCVGLAHAQKQSEDRKTSLIIPCYAGHAQYLFDVLSMYEQQTVLPDEVVISLSDVQNVSDAVLQSLQETKWVFPVMLITTKAKRFAGENRNIACQQAKSGILACHDADDIPHPQRIEIINYFFKTYNIDHLIHMMQKLESIKEYKKGSLPMYKRLKKNDSVSFQLYDDFEVIPFFYRKNFHSIQISPHYTQGAVAITRQVFNTIQWPDAPRGQDTIFNNQVYETFKRCVAVQIPLYVYRPFLSSVGGSGIAPTKIAYPEYTDQKRSKQYRIVIKNL